MYSLLTRQHAQAAALLHAGEILLSLPHVGVDLVHAILDPVQLLCTTQTNAQSSPHQLPAVYTKILVCRVFWIVSELLQTSMRML